MITEALILAAGKGSRMWPLTESTPKPLLPLCGSTIIEQQIIVLEKVGVKKINILIGHRMKEISDLLFSCVEKVINDGYRTKDISNSKNYCTTHEMGDAIVKEIRSR